MRIDLLELSETIDKSALQNEMNRINEAFDFNLTLKFWDDFITDMKPVENRQMELFA